MTNKIPQTINKISINTGNILHLNEIKKLTGQNQTDELVESLKISLSNWTPGTDDSNSASVDIIRDEVDGSCGEELDRDSLKISVKIFLLSAKADVLMDALNKVLLKLNITRVDSLILACKLEPSAVLSGLQNIWTIVEDLVTNNVVTDVGVCDVDTDVFIALYHWAKVKPRIIQINLAVCCVVPPILQEFCKENNVQLLTHSDPLDILPKPALYQILSAVETDSLALDWVVRYLMHIHSRGVLHSKGYLVSISRNNS